MLLVFLLNLTPFSADKVEIIREDSESYVYLIGNVVIEDESTKITCAEAKLNEAKGMAILNNNVKIAAPSGEINADAAVYFLQEQTSHLRGHVVLLTEDKIISSDSLFYDGKERFVEMFNNVKVEDTKNSFVAYAERGNYDLKQDQGSLSDMPRIEILRPNKEPMKITARTFLLQTEKNLLFGFDTVLAIIDSISVSCDTFSYNLKTERGDLTRPSILEKNNELTGEAGQFVLKSRNIDSFSVDRGWSRYYTKEGSENIVEGAKITIFFENGIAKKIIVEGAPRGVLNLKKRTVNDAAN